jgi:hypothetical protein
MMFVLANYILPIWVLFSILTSNSRSLSPLILSYDFNVSNNLPIKFF